MKPIDYRNANWQDIRDSVSGLREAVWRAFAEWGPGTTRCISQKSGIDILTLRPRATELYQLGFLKCAEDNAGKPPSTTVQPPSTNVNPHEGTYAACTADEALATFHARVKAARDPQLELTLA